MSERKHPEKDKKEPTEIAEAAADETPQPAENAPDVAKWVDQLAKLLAERDELRDTLIRRQADFENFRKRIERERLDDSRRAMGHLLHEILPALDNFERALVANNDPAYEEHRRGFELIYRQLWETLARQGLERIDATGKAFDPHTQHAMERVETQEYEDGTVVETLQPGYLFRGKVLRPAAVRVAVHSADESSSVRDPVN